MCLSWLLTLDTYMFEVHPCLVQVLWSTLSKKVHVTLRIVLLNPPCAEEVTHSIKMCELLRAPSCRSPPSTTLGTVICQ